MNCTSVARVTRLITVVGTAFILAGFAVQVTTLRLGVPHLQWGFRAVSDAGALGIGLQWVTVVTHPVGSRCTQRRVGQERDLARQTVYVARELLDALLDRATRIEPNREPLSFDTTVADGLDGVRSFDAARLVFSHFIHPSTGAAVRGVFDVDLSTAPGRAPKQFVSYPWGSLVTAKRDTLREIILAAVPSWDNNYMAASDRVGQRRPLRVVNAEPCESFDGAISTADPAASSPASSAVNE